MLKNFLITDGNAAEYVSKIGLFIKERVVAAAREGIVLGMSGGLDSAVAARLCQAAGVPALLIMLPDGAAGMKSKSFGYAKSFVQRFGFEYMVVDIGKICRDIEAAAGDLSPESRLNIRPRVRMSMLYSLAQTKRRFVLGTSNLSERLLGYFTKWGDGASDLNPLGMLVKSEVRHLSRALDIPKEIIEKAPSADLFEGQTDESDLGISYAEIDAFALTGTSGNAAADKKIKARIEMSLHKNNVIPLFGAI